MEVEKLEIVTKAEQLKTQGLYPEAENLYTEYIQQRVNNKTITDCFESKRLLSAAYNERGQLRYLQVDFNGAVQDYTTAIRLVPDSAVALYNRGQIYYRLGAFAEAVDDFQKALSFQPDFIDANLGLQSALQEVSVN